jgi:hypothetical protein
VVAIASVAIKRFAQSVQEVLERLLGLPGALWRAVRGGKRGAR